jgi:hypothetical protein
MGLLDAKELKGLFEKADGPCASIFLPTHRAGTQTQQGPIRLKNLLRQAEEQLLGSELERDPVAEMLAPARKLLEDGFFWQHQSDGLALFLSRQVYRTYRLPLALEERVVVGKRFYVKPLLPLLSGDGRFYILAVSQKSVRLLEATHHSVRELDLRDIPETLQDAVGYDWEERSLQFHTGSPRNTGGRRPAVFHGHGGGVENGKEEIGRFFRLVDDGCLALVEDRLAPLVLAAVDYLIPIYRQVSRHPNLVEEGVEGNPQASSAKELHDKAWALVAPRFLATQRQAAQRYRERSGSGRASQDLKNVLEAAYDGRVETLFVAVDHHQWGRFDPTTRTVECGGEVGQDGEDLLDLAAVQSLRHDATLFAVAKDEVPGGGSVAAVFRY